MYQAITDNNTEAQPANLKKSCQAIGQYLPIVIAFGSMASSSIFKQMLVAEISENASALSNIRSLMTSGIIPIELGIFNIMLSSVLQHRDKPYFKAIQSRIGSIYQVNVFLGLAAVLMNYGLMANTQDILNSSFFNLGLSDSDISSIQDCYRWDYAINILNVIYLNDFLMFYQNRNTASAALTIFCGEALDSLICYLLINYADAGLSSAAISDFTAVLLALMMSKAIQFGYVPKTLQSFFPSMQDYGLLNFHWEVFKDYLKMAFRNGVWAWLAALSGNISSVINILKFSSIGLQGALNVLTAACGNITDVVLSVLSPHIAENDHAMRRRLIIKQFLWGIVPNLVVMAIGLALPRQLSNALGGDDTQALSNNQLMTNIAVVMSSAVLSNAVTVAFQSFIDVSDTKWPSIIFTLGSLLNLGLCYALNGALAKSDAVGNYAGLISLSVTSAAMGLYYHCQSRCQTKENNAAVLFYEHEKAQLGPQMPLLADSRSDLTLAPV
jgi:hypothetical protein